MTIQFGVHLPLLNFGDTPWTVTRLSTYMREAAAAGFDYVCANDHLLFRQPWMDGPTALATVLQACPDMTIATTLALPVVRGPVQTAKLFAALHTLSDGRFVGGVGPGSSAADYAAAGVPFTERWKRFDEAVRVLRVLLGKDMTPFHGTFYSSDTPLEPPTASAGSPPLWIGSWGSPSGVRRVAELGDGWLASAYNTTPRRVQTHTRPARGCRRAHRLPERCSNNLAVRDRATTRSRSHLREHLGAAAEPTDGRSPGTRTTHRLSRAMR